MKHTVKRNLGYYRTAAGVANWNIFTNQDQMKPSRENRECPFWGIFWILTLSPRGNGDN